MNRKRLSPESETTIRRHYARARKRLILLDYDGTLAPIRARPEEASPTPELLDTLRLLCGDPRNRIVINSGRDKATLERWLGELPVTLAAEHGARYRENGVWHTRVARQQWNTGIMAILNLYLEKTPRSRLEVKDTALAWHYRECDPWLGELRAQQLTRALVSVCLRHKLQIIQGSKVLEIKSPEYSKGSEVRRLLEKGDAPGLSAAQAAEGVQIMSVHRSKGLEFPVVVLADLQKKFNQQDMNRPVLVHPQLGLGTERVDIEKRIRYGTISKTALALRLEREAKAEEMRILYVAMTRAKEKLILLDCRKHMEKKLPPVRRGSGCCCPCCTPTARRRSTRWRVSVRRC